MTARLIHTLSDLWEHLGSQLAVFALQTLAGWLAGS